VPEDPLLAVIIVEDDRAVADSLDALLRGAGHETRVFRSGEAMISAGPPRRGDTVVVDLGLPGISGSALLDWLNALAERPRLVVISGQSSGSIARQMAGVPPLTVLRKPPVEDWLKLITG
jgi:FixJ family two-component response regulator